MRIRFKHWQSDYQIVIEQCSFCTNVAEILDLSIENAPSENLTNSYSCCVDLIQSIHQFEIEKCLSSTSRHWPLKPVDMRSTLLLLGSMHGSCASSPEERSFRRNAVDAMMLEINLMQESAKKLPAEADEKRKEKFRSFMQLLSYK